MERLLNVLCILLGVVILVRGEYRMLDGLLKEPGGWSILGVYIVLGIALVLIGLIGHWMINHRNNC